MDETYEPRIVPNDLQILTGKLSYQQMLDEQSLTVLQEQNAKSVYQLMFIKGEQSDMNFPDFETVKGFYELNLWTKAMVAKAVELEHITSDDYKTITGEEYVAPAAK
ncbi:XkdX family protein [Lactiplantibacillus plantarum]|uniref:XkdX family protein n=1 Tax=Lactiplantibacillus plantarum TaxID=1590 RepID=UPI000534AE2E|nr:XkdX family protein [Lactiplantibacillus plantarum]MCX3292696.1 XkdX family protein [Lactiplantibacillus plantarum]MDB7782244.1 XkdX family protein [Lactiplantibacillus plantarum]MDB7783411.1 XkdX family protein [Lactiplantibacillus plantarum]POO11866.1 phage uncharacterized protein XkdX family [Lactiplantibacillus plantarum]UZM86844.1 XkdX family protein [Lactiplantibacillus plantarum]